MFDVGVGAGIDPAHVSAVAPPHDVRRARSASSRETERRVRKSDFQPVAAGRTVYCLRLQTIGICACVISAVGIALWWHARPQLPTPPPGWEVVDHVADGDTIVLGGGVTVRLVQIDTPEVYFHPECFGAQASAETKALLHRGTFVRLVRDPATSSRDVYGRLLRYVVRQDGLNVNVRLVADGAAAPYFFDGARGRYASVLMQKAKAARAARTGLWERCPGTRLDPASGVFTGAASDD